MRVSASKRFHKRYRQLPEQIKQKLDKQESLFISNPFHPSLHTEKLTPKSRQVWSFRVDKTYRVTFRFLKPDHVLLLTVGTHDHIYQRF
jgi:mRNA-degrading endonuclease RelE of RelBE toxin-antitoxin system